MRKSLIEQVQGARHAYIIHLATSRSGMRRRYSVYLDGQASDQVTGLDKGELDVLWPRDTGFKGKVAEPLLDGMVYSSDRKYPAFHFSIGGCGFSAMDEIRRTLCAINPSLEVMSINGHSPSHTL